MLSLPGFSAFKLKHETEHLSLMVLIDSNHQESDLSPIDTVEHLKKITEDNQYYDSVVQKLVDISARTKNL